METCRFAGECLSQHLYPASFVIIEIVLVGKKDTGDCFLSVARVISPFSYFPRTSKHYDNMI